MPAESPGVVVLGGGPAGLAAALACARAGAPVTLVEAAGRVGGLCRTLRRDGHAYDLGGHIPFVAGEDRRAWMEDLLDGDLGWVDRPVASVRDGRVVSGRYLDQRPEGPAEPTPLDGSAAGYLGALVGAEFRDAVMRRYLEKVDGMPLEHIPESRARKLDLDQRAPSGFWYPRDGIGALMDAMAGEAEGAGARVLTGTRVAALETVRGAVSAVAIEGARGPGRLPAAAVVAAVPAGRVVPLVRPGPPPGLVPALRMRATVIVVLATAREGLASDEPWIQVDDPRVPFSRVAELSRWSARMAPPGRAVLVLECYCDASPGDPVWSRDDAALAAACARALHEPLGLLDDPGAARVLDVLRLPRAYPLARADQAAEAARPAAWLGSVGRLHLAAGGTIVLAAEAGEAAAGAALEGLTAGAGAR